MRFGWSLLHHCSSEAGMQAPRTVSTRAGLTAGSQDRQRLRPLLDHSVGATSLRVRVIGKHGDVCQASAGCSRFTHFPAAARRCLFCERSRTIARQSTFPACTQEKPAKHPYSVARVFIASQGASDGADPPGSARRRPVAGVFPQLLLQDRPALHSLNRRCLSLPSAAASGSRCAGRAPKGRQKSAGRGGAG